MSSFEDLGGYNPEAEAERSSCYVEKQDRQRACAVTTLGFCLRVIVNEKP